MANAQTSKYPSPAVVRYVNLDNREQQRQASLRQLQLQELAPVILPEGAPGNEAIKHGAMPGHFGWPHAVMIDNVVVIHVKNLFLLRSADNGKTWGKPYFVDNAPILVMTSTTSGKIVAISIDRNPVKGFVHGTERKLSVLISTDKGKTWKRHQASVQLPVGAQGLTSRIIEHPVFGLIAGVHYNAPKDTLTFLQSMDEGQTWRAVHVPSTEPLDNNGIVLFEDGRGGIGAIVRNHVAIGGEYLQNWTSATQFTAINIASVKDFADVRWLGVRSNIWLRKEDCYAAQYNPVSRRIEAVATKRDWGVPQIDQGYMTLNLWSISPEAFRRGESHWRLEGTLLRSKGEKARLNHSRDGLHPAGTVIDTQQGLQHIFFYSGNRSHGGDGAPETGNTGIFRISRSLNTAEWVAQNRKLENYEGYAHLREEFKDIDSWEKSGSPTDRMILERTEPAFRIAVPIPAGTVQAKNGTLFVKTGEPGYYGLHRDDILSSVDFVCTFRVRIRRFGKKGYPVGIHVNTGAEKFDFLIRQDGIYDLSDPTSEFRKRIDVDNDNSWHDWRVEMKNGNAQISRDGELLGAVSVRIDGRIGDRPLTISSFSHYADDPHEFEMERLEFNNIDRPDETSYRNSIGMELLPIEPGRFIMGNRGEIDYVHLLNDELHTPFLGKGAANPYIQGGAVMQDNPLEWDEKPIHSVTVSRSYFIASRPVTNAQFEQFQPSHEKLRGKEGFSRNDDDAVIYVSWEDAVAFTKWLSKKEGRNYRLPTEAEWEYAARAGTRTAYSTGDVLPRQYWQHQTMNRSHSIEPDSVELTVGRTAANSWGLQNVHGLVEEWCSDWYGPYNVEQQIDPVGPANGVARVTRGGSHSTGVPFLRSANRSAALPGTTSMLIGFRVVQADPLPVSPAPSMEDTTIWARGVNQETDTRPLPGDDAKPIFTRPKTFTRVPPGSNGPLYFIHNHEPALTALPNGDLLAIWFTTTTERGREMAVAGARLRKGAADWDQPDLFFKIADRNMTGQALFWDGDSTIYHFSGVGQADDWKRLSLVMRKSTDNAVTWSAPEIIGPEYGSRHQLIDAVVKTTDGKIVFLCDAHWSPEGGSAVHVSNDNGKTWKDIGEGQAKPLFTDGSTGHFIAGRHAGIVELRNGDWLALGRGDAIDGKMPKSISHDKGVSWTYSASVFNPIRSAQRLSLIRLKEGPLLLLSFEQEMTQIVSNGKSSSGIGMYAALSFDDGETWPIRKLITPGTGSRILDAPCNWRWGPEFSLLDASHGEQRGYLTADQAPDGIIHVLSSGTHYSFNLKWITEPALVPSN